jgi:hypothetical protein
LIKANNQNIILINISNILEKKKANLEDENNIYLIKVLEKFYYFELQEKS